VSTDNNVAQDVKAPTLQVTPVSLAAESGALRPFVEGHALAGFMTTETIRTFIPTFDGLPRTFQTALQERLGASTDLDLAATVGKPRLFRIEEREVLGFLTEVAQVVPAGLENLLGFEWVEIKNIVAGHLVTKPIVPGTDLITGPTPLQLAQYCMLSFGDGSVPIEVRREPRPRLVSNAAMNVTLVDVQLADSQFALVYKLSPILAPIQLLVIDNQVIAIRGLEKLVRIAERGIDHALCLVSYGYGTSALTSLPSTPSELLGAQRPPLISDFLNPSLTAPVPARSPLTVFHFGLEGSRIYDD
jgi:hypothetical protein